MSVRLHTSPTGGVGEVVQQDWKPEYVPSSYPPFLMSWAGSGCTEEKILYHQSHDVPGSWTRNGWLSAMRRNASSPRKCRSRAFRSTGRRGGEAGYWGKRGDFTS